MYFLLFYDYVDDYLDRRAPVRPEHFELANAAHERGELVLAGAITEPPYEGVLVWKVDDAEVIERFVAADPYVRDGVVKSWRIRPWTVVIGGD